MDDIIYSSFKDIIRLFNYDIKGYNSFEDLIAKVL